MEIFQEDFKSLLSQTKHQEKQLRLKRRWLMELPLSRSERKQLEEIKYQKNRFIPEKLLREDDVYYETIKTLVEKGFGACKDEGEHRLVEDNMQFFDLRNDLKNIFSMLDDMTNKGLYRFAEILTGGSTKFEKTRWKIKQFIKELLPKILRNRNDNHHMNVMKQLSQLLKDPCNFRDNNHMIFSTHASQSYHAAAVNVLDGLEDLPFRTLSAMHRKLRGIMGYMPQMKPSKKCGWSRDILIEQVRKSCVKMLSQLGEEDELQEPLAKAMAVAGLTSRLILHSPFVTEFIKFSPEIEALQNDIAKAIWLLKKKVRFPELKILQILLDPNAELSNRSLRVAIRNLLTEYLLECSDMDTIPECLVQTLAIINKSSRSSCRSFSKEEIEEEVECVLSVSAQTKQILWDLLPEHESDQDFADAYIEELEESDDADDYNGEEKQKEIKENGRLHPSDSNDQIESMGENNPTNSKSFSTSTKGHASSPLLTPNKRLKVKLESVHINEIDSVDSYGCASSLCLESKIFKSPQSMGGIHYHSGSMWTLGRTDSPSLPSIVNRSYSSGHFAPDGRSDGKYGEKKEPKVELVMPSDSVSCGEADFVHDKQSMSKNQYLAIQEACDQTCMIVHRLIGRLLDEFAQMDDLELDSGDISYLRGCDSIRRNSQVVTKEKWVSHEKDVRGSLIIEVLEDLLPSFPKSQKEKLKELLDLK